MLKIVIEYIDGTIEHTSSIEIRHGDVWFNGNVVGDDIIHHIELKDIVSQEEISGEVMKEVDAMLDEHATFTLREGLD